MFATGPVLAAAWHASPRAAEHPQIVLSSLCAGEEADAEFWGRAFLKCCCFAALEFEFRASNC
jgi:hypothetical protein